MVTGQNNKYYPWLPFATLLRKEILRFLRVTTQTLLTPIVTASLYLFVFGATLGNRLNVLEGFSYAQFVIPGLIIMGVINNTFANTSSSLFMSRYLGGIVDLLVTPVSPPQFIMAYTLAAMLRGLLVGTVVWLISTLFAVLPWESPLLAILMAVIASFLFAQFGLIAAIYAHNFDTLSMYSNFLILPLVYLGGVFYPISILPDPWSSFSYLNPLFYLIDGFRHAIIGVGDTSYLIAFGVSLGIATALFIWAAWLIGKGHRLRS
ncbi:MAG: ABC transporter permease [Thermodesulfobacteriota bacterium]|nr:ABC transporter permease [Thermodesulfobacteriota bacterium]